MDDKIAIYVNGILHDSVERKLFKLDVSMRDMINEYNKYEYISGILAILSTNSERKKEDDIKGIIVWDKEKDESFQFLRDIHQISELHIDNRLSKDEINEFVKVIEHLNTNYNNAAKVSIQSIKSTKNVIPIELPPLKPLAYCPPPNKPIPALPQFPVPEKEKPAPPPRVKQQRQLQQTQTQRQIPRVQQRISSSRLETPTDLKQVEGSSSVRTIKQEEFKKMLRNLPEETPKKEEEQPTKKPASPVFTAIKKFFGFE